MILQRPESPNGLGGAVIAATTPTQASADESAKQPITTGRLGGGNADKLSV